MRNILILVCVLPIVSVGLIAQTKVDLKTQSKNIDFGSVSSVRPFTMGTVLPATCIVGQMFFKTDAPAGSNSYGCVATSIWSMQGQQQAQSGTVTPNAAPMAVVQSDSITLTIGAGCSSVAPCLARIGSIVYTFQQPSTAVLQSGSGTAYIYINENGVVTVGSSTTDTVSVTCTGCQTDNVSQFPTTSIPLATWTGASGGWVTGTDERAILSAGRTFTAGPNVTLAEAGSNVTISAAAGTLPTGTPPVCGSTTRGNMWIVESPSGVKDVVQVCAKDASDVYAWRALY